MSDQKQAWMDFIKKIPGLVVGLITFVTSVVGFVKLFQGESDLVTIVLLIVGIGGGLVGCAYVAFMPEEPEEIRGLLADWWSKRGSSERKYKYPRRRLWGIAGLVVIPLFTAGGIGYHIHQQAQPPDKVIIFVAEFDGPEPKNYRVTETVWESLNRAMEGYDDVQLIKINSTFKESTEARDEGNKGKATIVIWGWYGVTEEAVSLSVHFEVLRSPQYFPGFESGTKDDVQIRDVAELEGFDLQTQLSREINFLSLFTVGITRFAAEDWEGAIDSLSNALLQGEDYELSTSQRSVLFYRGLAYSYIEKLDLAIADYDRIIEMEPNFAEAYCNRGSFFQDQGELERAIADYKQVIEIRNLNSGAHNNLGTAYHEKGELDLALEEYRIAVDINPMLFEAYNNLGVIYKTKGDFEKALENYTKAIEGYKKDDPSNLGFAAALNNRGTMYLEMGELEKAIEDFNRAIDLNFGIYGTDTYYKRGIAYNVIGDLNQAIEDYTEAIELNPEYSDVFYYRGKVYKDKEELDLAIEDYTKAIELNPEYSEAFYNRGIAHQDKGDLDLAIEDYTKAIELNPEYSEAFYNRGIAYQDKGDLDHAIVDYSKAIELGMTLAYNNRGVAYGIKGMLDKAISDLTQDILLNPDDALGYYNRGFAYANMGEFDLAIEDYSEAIRLDPEDARAYYFRGLAYKDKGDLDRAFYDFEMVLKMSDDLELRKQTEEMLEALKVK